jgi:transposase-like protein
MTKKHRTFSPDFKAQAVLAVLSGSKTAAEICREHQLKPDLFSKWKTSFLANAAKVFERETTVDPQQRSNWTWQKKPRCCCAQPRATATGD